MTLRQWYARCLQYLRKHLWSPSCDGGEQTRPQVTSRVDGIAGVEAHGQADDQDGKANGEGLQALRNGVVMGVHYGQDADDQGSGANGLLEKHTA